MWQWGGTSGGAVKGHAFFGDNAREENWREIESFVWCSRAKEACWTAAPMLIVLGSFCRVAAVPCLESSKLTQRDNPL
jgi:hypothetical protein